MKCERVVMAGTEEEHRVEKVAARARECGISVDPEVVVALGMADSAPVLEDVEDRATGMADGIAALWR